VSAQYEKRGGTSSASCVSPETPCFTTSPRIISAIGQMLLGVPQQLFGAHNFCDIPLHLRICRCQFRRASLHGGLQLVIGAAQRILRVEHSVARGGSRPAFGEIRVGRSNG